MLDQGVDALRQNALEVALTGTSSCVSGHHARDGGVGSKKRSEFCGGLELGREDGLEHGEEEMFLTTFILVSIEGEHDSLE